MKISIRAKNIKLTPELKSYVNEKILKTLESRLSQEKEPLEVSVELIRLTRHHRKGLIFRAEVQLILHGHQIISEEKGETIEQAIDRVKDELEREIESHKGKETTITRKRNRFLKKLINLSPLARFKKRNR